MSQPTFHLISLGEFCGPAQVVEAVNLRTGSYPFDWLYSFQKENIDFVLEMLQQKSIESVYQKYVTIHYELGWDRNKYGFVFPHEPNVYSDEFKEKFRRRIQRFYDLIVSGATIYFVFSNRSGKLDGPLFDLFITEVNKVNRKCKLIIFHGDETLKVTHPNVVQRFYNYGKCPDSEIAARDNVYKGWMRYQLADMIN